MTVEQPNGAKPPGLALKQSNKHPETTIRGLLQKIKGLFSGFNFKTPSERVLLSRVQKAQLTP
jgi:hypothetical protein